MALVTAKLEMFQEKQEQSSSSSRQVDSSSGLYLCGDSIEFGKGVVFCIIHIKGSVMQGLRECNTLEV